MSLAHVPESMPMTEEEYLAFEDATEYKHEFSNGRIYAMTGGTARHSFITVNTSTEFNLQLRDKDCRVASPDLRVKAQSKKSYRYPDVMVICGELQYVNNRHDTITNPIVLVEVLSPSTAVVDRNQKFDEYTHIPTLQEYVIIWQSEPRIEIYLRQESGDWLYKSVIGLDSTIELPSIGVTLKFADIYRKVDFDTEEDA